MVAGITYEYRERFHMHLFPVHYLINFWDTLFMLTDVVQQFALAGTITAIEKHFLSIINTRTNRLF